MNNDLKSHGLKITKLILYAAGKDSGLERPVADPK